MAFDWIQLLNARHIQFDTQGKNVSKGFVAVACPFCGSDDPSRHMTISLSGGGWRCWRNPRHSGGSPVKLVAALLRISYIQARAIVGVKQVVIPDSLGAAVRTKLLPQPQIDQTLELPPEFRRFKGQYTSKRFERYLRDRGFPHPIQKLAEDYDLYYALSGRYHGRVLFTIRDLNGSLMGWTGRTIYKVEDKRYDSFGPIGHYLLWLDRLPRPHSHTLILVEGPADAMKVAVFGEKLGVDATCCFTGTPTKQQLAHLYRLMTFYKHRYIMLDRGEVSNSGWTTDMLAPMRAKPLPMPSHLKDPGEIADTHELRRILGLAYA